MSESEVVSPSFMLLNCSMDLAELVGSPGPEWESIHCASKKAYGCGKHDRKLVEGLALYVRRLELPDISSLTIRLNDEALRSIQAVFGGPGGRVRADGAVMVVSEQLLVLLVMFSMFDRDDHFYYLVFDSTIASLCMIPDIPSHLYRHFNPRTAVPVRTADGNDYELLLMAIDIYCVSLRHVRLCLCTPATGVCSPSDGAGPWKVTEDHRCLPKLSRVFKAHVMFSFQGKAFWGDLAQGIAYCDLRAKDGALKLDFIKLPKAFRIHSDDEQGEPWKNRTMGCTGDSIKFICIDRDHPGNEMVKGWTLDLVHRRWKQSKGIAWKKELWKKVSFIQAAMGDIVPRHPTLMADGTLCLLLGNKGDSTRGTDSICCFDIASNSLVSGGCVVNYDTVEPIFVPYNFFRMCNPPPRKRKLLKHAGELSVPKKKVSTHRMKLPKPAGELSMPKKKVPTHKMKLPTIVKQKPKRRALSIQ